VPVSILIFLAVDATLIAVIVAAAIAIKRVLS
jgi:hypothetical protein